MNNYLVVFFLLFLFTSCSKSLKQNVDCEFSSLGLSKLAIPTTNIAYLETILGFSYGEEVIRFIPLIKKFESNFYYRISKDFPVMTYTSSEYHTLNAAKDAYVHLKSKWAHLDSRVVKRDRKTVTLYGSDTQTVRCFNKLVNRTRTK